MYCYRVLDKTILTSYGDEITETDALWIRFLTLLLFYPLSAFAMEKEEYFQSPDRISCQLPSLVVFHHEDNHPNLDKGNYGEQQLKRTFIKFAAIIGDMDVYKNNDKSDNGYDFVLVDHGKKLITFLEAKSSDFNTMLQRRPSEKPTKKKQQEYKELLLNPGNQTSREKIKTQLQNLLGDKKVDQLSRRWCYNISSKEVKLDYSSKKDSIEDSSLFDLKNLIENKHYNFMRLASFTIVNSKDEKGDADNVPIFATTTYYLIIQDGDPRKEDKKTPASEVKKRDIIVNGGLGFLWDNQELGLPKAKDYLNQIYDALFKYHYPIRIIDTLPSTPVRSMPLSPNLSVVANKTPAKKKNEDFVISRKRKNGDANNNSESKPSGEKETSSEIMIEDNGLNVTQNKRYTGKVEESGDGDTMTNIPRYIAAVQQENEGLNDLANFNYHLGLGEETEKDFPSSFKQEGPKNKKHKGNDLGSDSKKQVIINNSNNNAQDSEKNLSSLAQEIGFHLGDLEDEMEIARFIIAKIHWSNVVSAQKTADSLDISKTTYNNVRNKVDSPKTLSAVKSCLKDQNSNFYKFARQSLQKEESTKLSITKMSNWNEKEAGNNLALLAKKMGYKRSQDENKMAKFILKSLLAYRDSSSSEEDSDSRHEDYIQALRLKITNALGVSESILDFFIEEDFGSPLMVSAIKSALADKKSTFYTLVKRFLRDEELLSSSFDSESTSSSDY